FLSSFCRVLPRIFRGSDFQFDLAVSGNQDRKMSTGAQPARSPDNEVLQAALQFARRGWHVFPIYEIAADGSCACGKPGCMNWGKHPRTRHGLKDACCDERVIRAWWSQWPSANVAIATGSVSGVVVLDIDPRPCGGKSLAGPQAQ